MAKKSRIQTLKQGMKTLSALVALAFSGCDTSNKSPDISTILNPPSNITVNGKSVRMPYGRPLPMIMYIEGNTQIPITVFEKHLIGNSGGGYDLVFSLPQRTDDSKATLLVYNVERKDSVLLEEDVRTLGGMLYFSENTLFVNKSPSGNEENQSNEIDAYDLSTGLRIGRTGTEDSDETISFTDRKGGMVGIRQGHTTRILRWDEDKRTFDDTFRSPVGERIRGVFHSPDETLHALEVTAYLGTEPTTRIYELEENGIPGSLITEVQGYSGQSIITDNGSTLVVTGNSKANEVVVNVRRKGNAEKTVRIEYNPEYKYKILADHDKTSPATISVVLTGEKDSKTKIVVANAETGEVREIDLGESLVLSSYDVKAVKTTTGAASIISFERENVIRAESEPVPVSQEENNGAVSSSSPRDPVIRKEGVILHYAGSISDLAEQLTGRSHADGTPFDRVHTEQVGNTIVISTTMTAPGGTLESHLGVLKPDARSVTQLAADSRYGVIVGTSDFGVIVAHAEKSISGSSYWRESTAISLVNRGGDLVQIYDAGENGFINQYSALVKHGVLAFKVTKIDNATGLTDKEELITVKLSDLNAGNNPARRIEFGESGIREIIPHEIIKGGSVLFSASEKDSPIQFTYILRPGEDKPERLMPFAGSR